MKANQFHTSGIARSGACFIAALCLGVGSALADHSVTVDLSGVRIDNGINFFRNSGTARLDPAMSYTYAVTGTCHGTVQNSLMMAIAPSKISFRALLNTLKKGSGGFLSGTCANPSGTFPATLSKHLYTCSATSPLGPVSISVNFNGGVYGGSLTDPASLRGQVYYQITGTSIVPPIPVTIGALVFNPGSKLVVTAVP